MSEPAPATDQLLHFEASDGTRLVGDLALPAAPHAAVVLCHPHPQYGGNRHNPVVAALHTTLPRSGVASFRFDFRADFDGGVGERLDAHAAIELVAERVAHLPVAVVGYSFGAWIALAVANDPVVAGAAPTAIAAVVAVAPPLAAMEQLRPPQQPTLVLTPGHDQFSDPAHNEPVVREWRANGASTVEHSVVPMADHFLTGSTAAVAQQADAWLSEQFAAPRR